MTRATRPTRSPLAALAVSAAILFAAGCASEAGNSAGTTSVASTEPVNAVADGGALKQMQAQPVTQLTSTALRQRFLTQPRPAEIVAKSYADLDETLVYAQRATSGEASRVRGARWTEAAQVGLLFGSPEGKTFLAAPAGRALVRGEPAESCPALNVATGRTDDTATDGALRACLREMSERSDCGCRVIARGDRLLAPRDDFQYAIGVATQVIAPNTGKQLSMTAEERMIPGRPGSRRLWMLSVLGPFGMLQTEPDGRAAFVLSRSGKRYDGVHRADGFRRGRVARRAYLTAADGSRMIVLVGYEDAELKENRATLSAWNPHGRLDLKKAEAN